VAGLLVATVGPVATLFVNAATFAVSAVLTWALVPATSVERPDEAGAPTSYWSDLAAGFRFVVRDPLMRLIVALVLVTNLFDAARSSSMLPLYANERLGGAAALGLLVAVMGGAALLGNVAFGFVAHRVPRRVTFAVCFVLVGGPSNVAFALGAPLPVLVATTALAGLAAGALNPILGAVEFERVPAHMRGRVFGLLNAGAWAGVPVGALLGGIAVDTIGFGVAFGIMAVLYTLVTLTPLSGGTWRQMERSPRSPEAPAG
jgi:MFS family permease